MDHTRCIYFTTFKHCLYFPPKYSSSYISFITKSPKRFCSIEKNGNKQKRPGLDHFQESKKVLYHCSLYCLHTRSAYFSQSIAFTKSWWMDFHFLFKHWRKKQQRIRRRQRWRRQRQWRRQRRRLKETHFIQISGPTESQIDEPFKRPLVICFNLLSFKNVFNEKRN